MSTLAVIGALLTIVGPALTPLLVMWVERYTKKKTQNEDIDAYITAHLKGDPHGLRNLSAALERLSLEAARKRRHPGQ